MTVPSTKGIHGSALMASFGGQGTTSTLLCAAITSSADLFAQRGVRSVRKGRHLFDNNARNAEFDGGDGE